MILSACLVTVVGHAEETVITVLGVMLPGSNYTRSKEFLDDLADSTYWDSSYQDVGVTIRLANWGIPIPMPAPMQSTGVGDPLEQAATAHADAENYGLRNNADVVIYFTGSFDNPNTCGEAENKVWTDGFGPPPEPRWQPGSNGLDLRGSENSYEAIVATDGAICPDDDHVALHELGHLLGAGHETSASSPDCCLFLYSHAHLISFAGMGLYTIVAQQTEFRTLYPFWSTPTNYLMLGSTDNNLSTVQTTGRSVANYRVDAESIPPPPPFNPPQPLPPGCSLQSPSNLTAVLVAECDPFPTTHYRLYWSDLCPGAALYYQVEYSQPVGHPYVNSVTSVSPWADVVVQGVPAQVRVRACDGFLCSGPSNSDTIFDTC